MRPSIRISPSAPSRLTRGGRLTNSRLAGRRRWAFLALLAIASLLAFAFFSQAPTRLADYVLAGERSPACVRTVVLRDQSGSMVGFEAVRETVMQQIVVWSTAPETLRADDEFAIIDFAEDGIVALPTTTVAELDTKIPGNTTTSGDTDLGAGILAMRSLPGTNCHTSLVVLSDGLISALTAEDREELESQAVTHVTLVLPAAGGAPPEWSSQLPYSAVVAASASDADQTARAVAGALATSVDQRLERR